MIEKHLGMGIFPDVAVHAGRIWVAWQHATGAFLVSLELDTLRELTHEAITLGPGAGAFCKLHSESGRLWLVYREGEPGEWLWLLEIGTENLRSLGRGHGTDPALIGHGYVFWQSTPTPAYRVRRRPLIGTEPPRDVRDGAPTGLSRVVSEQEIRLVDEDRTWVSGMTRPAWAGDVVVGEYHRHENDGAIARLTNGRELVLWPSQESFTPRVAWDGGQRYAVVTWGDVGVRVAQVSPQEFGEPVPDGPVEDTSGQPIDPLLYMFGALPNRDGSHPMYWYVDPNRRRWYEVKFGNRDSWEAFAWTDTTISLFEDRSQSEPDFDPPWDYAYTEDVWMTRPMRTGDRIEHDENRLIRFDPRNNAIINAPGMPFPYETRLHKVYSSYPFGGSVGTRPAIEVDAYVLGSPYFERHTYTLGVGRVIWQAIDARTGAQLHRTTFLEIGGPALVPTVGGRDSNAWPPPLPEDDMQKPGVQITRFDPVIRPGQPWRVEFHDRNNPEQLTRCVVEFVNGSVHVEIENEVGEDRSGTRRSVEVRCDNG